MEKNKERNRAEFAEYSSELARAGKLAVSFDHHCVNNKTGDEETDIMGISLTMTNQGEKHSALLAYTPAVMKNVATNVEIINDFADDYGIRDELNAGTLPMVSDGALLSTSKAISPFYSSCNLHDAQRLQQNIIDLLPQDLKAKFESITTLINRASKKKTKKEMRGKHPTEKSLNKFMRAYVLSDEQKEYMGDQMKGLKRTSKIRFR